MAIALLAGVFAGCSGSSQDPINSSGNGPQAGSEGGACITTGTPCDVGLVCLSNLCVKPGAGGASDGGGGDDGMGDMDMDGGGTKDVAVDSPPACTFKHPLLDGGLRYCGAGECYCSNPDSCYPMGTAQACCSATVVCY